MRLIVNKKQYNKILKHQKKKTILYEGLINFIFDNVIIYEKNLITESNIRKNNINKKIKNTIISSITIDFFKGEETLVEAELFGDLLEMNIILPKHINHNDIKHKLLLELSKHKLLIEQEDKRHGLNFSKLSLGDKISLNYLIERIRKSLNYDRKKIEEKLLFIDGISTFNNGGILNIDTTKFTKEELDKIIIELEKYNNSNYVLSVDKNGEEVKEIGIDFDSYVALNKTNNNKKVNTDDTDKNDDTDTNDDFVEVDLDDVPADSFTSAIPVSLHPAMYLISDVESGHNYNIQEGERSPSVILTDKTIKQVSLGGDYGTNAKGRWQHMPKYIKKRAKAIGLKDTDKFSKINQDKMAMYLIKGWENWDCKKLGDELAKIWAAVPVLYDQQGDKKWVKRGESFYKGIAGNKALIDVDKFETAVRKSGCKVDNKKVVTDDSTDFEEEGSESTPKDGKIKILIIGDSHSADVGKNYSRKLLNKEKYDGTILARAGKKPKWMYDELVKIKDKIKEYDYFIVMGGGNAAYRATPDIAISNLDKIYKLIKQQKGSDTKIIGITPPHKRFAYDKSYPSNQGIADWVLSQKPSQLLHTLNLTNDTITAKYFEDDALHLTSKLHDIIVQNLEKQIK